MPANLSKKSVVKHRTHKPFHSVNGKRGSSKTGETGTGANSTSLGDARSKGKGRSGFQVGPKHAPDGAYLGRAKKIKADLIEKAKIKKRFFKSIKGSEGQATESGGKEGEDFDMMLDRDEGKFAPEKRDEEDGQDNDILYQMRNREEVAAQKLAKKGKVKAVKQTKTAPPTASSSSAIKLGKSDSDNLSKEERQRIREKKMERYHSQSGSQKGRERGQPNLGARMDLLLERIKQQS